MPRIYRRVNERRNHAIKYRLGIDLGTNSLGWAIIQLDDELAPRQLVDIGVRIFSDARNPKDKSSNAAQRRGPRGARRNRDRRLQRAERLMNALVDTGLAPRARDARKALAPLDPWVLRARALDEELAPHEIGRALLHLGKRRGFKSNRKTDGDDAGKMYDAIERTRARLKESDARTLGELFGRPRIDQAAANAAAEKGKRRPLPLARVRKHGTGASLVYDYYPQRDMILDEFDRIWAAQARRHPALMTPAARDRIRGIIAHQRPLKSPDVGKCAFLHDQPRAAKALPSVQRFRILQEVNNLTVGATGETPRPLTPDERAALIDFLAVPSSKTAKRSFDQMRRKLGLPPSQTFNLESEKRKDLQGDLTAAQMMQPAAFGKAWFDLPPQEQDRIVGMLIDEEDADALAGRLVAEAGRTPEQAAHLASLRLPDGYGKVSGAAIARMTPRLEQGERFDEAARAEFGDHRAIGDGVVHDDGLPYYGEILSRYTAFEKDDPANDEERYGRVSNPTVHVALNELRKVVNDLIKRHGPPTQAALEMARELPLSDRGLKELERRQKDNQDANDRRRAKLAALGVADTYENRLKLRLYEELPPLRKACVFSGEPIEETALFTDAIEVEHILPISKTRDDSFANKALAARAANRIKGARAPYDAFGASPDGYDWEQIIQRAEDLPRNKRWRFAPDAMGRFENAPEFEDRQLNDTRYIARLGKTFLEALFGGQGAAGQENAVWVVTGRLTADLRHYAGFNGLLNDDNRKTRTDHRHHAIDAVVIALTDRAMVKRASDLARREDGIEHHDIMKAMAEPLRRYRPSLEDRLGKMTVSHKPDHGFQDAMHNDTAYGITGARDDRGQMILVTRKPLNAIDKPSQLGDIRDPVLRARFTEAGAGLTGKAFTDALVREGAAMTPPVNSVRVLDVMKDSSCVVIEHGTGHRKAYKGDGNYCYDLGADDKGKWTGAVVTTFQAYQRAQADPEWQRRLHRNDETPLLMRIRKGDMLEIDGPGGRRRVVVRKFSEGKINMSEHHEADASGRIARKELEDIQLAPSSLQKANAVYLAVSPSGAVKRKKITNKV